MSGWLGRQMDKWTNGWMDAFMGILNVTKAFQRVNP